MTSHPDYTARSKRYTVGFLSEKASFESEALIFQGAQQAAEQYDIHLLYIAPLEDNDEADHYGYAGVRSAEEARLRHDRLKAYLDSLELDGLFCIGWARAFNDDLGPYLLERLKPLPLVTIGKSLSADIPSVIMPGGPYIKQLALHLAREHRLRRIAYVCPWSDDERLDSYIEAMQEAGQHDERLIVRTGDLEGPLDIAQRMRRAAAVLLDERRLAVDAIMVMSAYECAFMLEALHARGLRIPEDIALVCYEDDPVVENATPSMTTIDYPYRKLGHAACELLVRQLDGQTVPARTDVETVIRYRDSCGCTVNDVKPMQAQPALHGLVDRTAAGLLPAEIGGRLRDSMPPDLHGLDYEGLAASCLSSIEQRNGWFLEAFSREIHRLVQTPEGLDQLVERFREAFLPLVGPDRGRYELAEALWFGARHILKNYMSRLALSRSIQENEKNRIVNHIYQQLQTVEYVSDVAKVLNHYLGWLQVPSVSILLNPPEAPQPEAARPFFCFGEDLPVPPDADMPTLYRLQRDAGEERMCLVVSPLLMNGERLGFIWAKPGTHRTHTLFALFDQIGSAVKSAQVQEESRENEARLAYYANVDSLTRLFNRRYFYDALAAAAADGRAFTVLYIDIDGFKQVNDTHGHDAGDRLLVQIADRLRHALTDGAFPLPQPVPTLGLTEMGSIFRLGGDEFTALLRTTDVGEAAAYARELCAALRRPYVLDGHTARVSASIGLARYPEDTPDAHRLLKLADLALYRAKEDKDQYRFYHELS